MGDYSDPFMRNQDAAVQARAKAQNRSNVLQLKLIGQSHPTGLTNNLLKLFEPRPPLEFKPPLEKRKPLPYTGMAQFVSHFAEPDDPEYAPPIIKGETPLERKARIQKIKLEKGAAKAAEELEKYDPHKEPNATGDPYKTLFVARLNYETTENRIKREFEAYGPIKRVRLVTDVETNKPRGYAFIEYMHTRDMKTAYKQADGKKLDNKRVLVDVERGRTVPNWRPRRLGGGLGSTRIGGDDLNQRISGREIQSSGGHHRSEEPRAREDRRDDRDREKSRERGRDRERDREREKSRDRDAREERHRHRDRERTIDPDRDRDSSRRDRDRDRESSRRSGRDRDRERGRDSERDRDRERDRPRKRDRERERSHEKDADDAQMSKHADREMDYEHHGEHERYDEKRVKYEHHGEHERYDEKHDDRVKREPEEYGNEDLDAREEGEAVAEHGYGYVKSERSLSRDREYDR